MGDDVGILPSTDIRSFDEYDLNRRVVCSKLRRSRI